MSIKLTKAIDIADYSEAILQRVEAFDFDLYSKKRDWSFKAHLSIDPMLLGFAMELALKAWYAFDHDELTKGHDLVELFNGLSPQSREILKDAFKEHVEPYHPNFFYNDFSLNDVLFCQRSAFNEWRYTYENREVAALSFDQSVFIATLEMVISEFRKRYRTVQFPLSYNLK